MCTVINDPGIAAVWIGLDSFPSLNKALPGDCKGTDHDISIMLKATKSEIERPVQNAVHLLVWPRESVQKVAMLMSWQLLAHRVDTGGQSSG